VSEDRWVGKTIDGRYRIEKPLGYGGMGSVYEAEHVALGKRVALKVIHRELVKDEETRARFEREARATGAIDHPHVAAGMDFGRLPDGGAYLVVQLVAGDSLRKRMERGPMSWREACTIGAQIADALTAIHARGFIHRDLTSENVLLTSKDGAPFAHVLDLGIAALVDARPEHKLTAEGHVVGTPGYMPPEQALGKPTDARADLYSLGVLLWEMCSGRSLYGAKELTQVLALQLTESPPAIAQLAAPSAPPELSRLVTRLLAREPEDRPKDAASVRDALRRFAKSSAAMPWLERYGVAALGVIVAGLFALSALGATIGLAVWLFSSDEEEAPAVATEASVPEPEVEQAAAPPDGVAVSPEVASAIERLSQSRYRHQRRAAAQVLAQAPDTPEWARAIADLELARTCGDRRDALDRIVLHPSIHARAAVERLRDTRTGCGRGGGGDCYTCVRAEIERAYEALPGS
jgi:tRNA A-37 threonylcarbamoyl transferase component Bud32